MVSVHTASVMDSNSMFYEVSSAPCLQSHAVQGTHDSANRSEPHSASCSLARMFPDKLVLGMEIREKVTEYVARRIDALRKEHAVDTTAASATSPGPYQNVSVVRANTMKYMCNYFCKQQLEKLFFLFPDPHFKASNHR